MGYGRGARADLVIVPSRPTVKDLERVEASIKLATVYDPRPVFVVLTQTRPRGDRDAQVEEFVRAKNYPVCPVRIGHRVTYEDSDTLGRIPLETEPNGKAGLEIKQLYRYTVKMLNHKTIKEVNHEKERHHLNRRAV